MVQAHQVTVDDDVEKCTKTPSLVFTLYMIAFLIELSLSLAINLVLVVS